MKPLFLNASAVHTIWGGNQIATMRGVQENLGTWWEVSAHPSGVSTVRNLEGHPSLLDVINTDPDDVLGPGYTLHEMLRCAYLDTKEDLSIQVHPDDAYAQKHSHDYGKYESWYIVHAKPGATLTAGTNTTDRKTIEQALQNGTLDPYLKKWPVQSGDYITIPSGTLHALGKGILAFEVGTNSDTTYRFYDYNRIDQNGKKRPLHIEDSFQVVDFNNQPTFVEAKKESRRIGDTPRFIVDELYLDSNQTLHCDEHFFIVTNLMKHAIIFIWNETEMSLPALDSVFIPYSAGKITIKAGSHVLVSQPKKEKHKL